jgi:pimeloyl-ACP methyl ester carboxylesterase
MVTSQDIEAGDGRTLRAYDSGDAAADADAMVLMWHHGSPQTGALLAPLLAAAGPRGIRMLSYARPSYGGSSPALGRDVASAAADAARVADAFGVDRFAVMGASGGGPHALACAALLPDRVSGAVCLGGIAPYSQDFDWFAGMRSPGGLRVSLSGRAARARYAETAEFDEKMFTAADHAALAGEWEALGADAAHAGLDGPDGQIDDDVAYVNPWGFRVEQVDAPVLVVQGGEDRVIPPSHADWLLRHCPRAELWLRPRDGHISVLAASPVAMDWLRASR